MTLGDIKLDNSLSRFLSRTLSRYHFFQYLLCSLSQVLELSEGITLHLLEDKNGILLLCHFPPIAL